MEWNGIDGIKDKKFEYYGDSRKINVLGELPKTEGLGQIADLRSSLLKKRGVFLRVGRGGVDTPMYTIKYICIYANFLCLVI